MLFDPEDNVMQQNLVYYRFHRGPLGPGGGGLPAPEVGIAKTFSEPDLIFKIPGFWPNGRMRNKKKEFGLWLESDSDPPTVWS